MKKIAIDARMLIGEMRGMPQYVYKLCELLPQEMEDVQFYFLTNTRSRGRIKDPDQITTLQNITKAKNVEVIDIPCTNDAIWEQVKLPWFLYRNKIDMVHMPGNRLCFTSPSKQIATIHDCMEYNLIEVLLAAPKNSNFKLKFFFWRRRFYVSITYRLLKLRAHKIVTVSQASARSISKTLSVPLEDIAYIHHGLPLGFSMENKPTALESRKGVLMLGGDGHQKNPVNAIEGWNLLPTEIKDKHPLTIAGFTGDKGSPISKTLDRLGLVDLVTVYNWISTTDLSELYSSSSVFLFVSREEGFGFPILQAMASGLPIVCSKADVFLELCNGAALHAEAESPNDIARSLLKLLSEDDLWQRKQALGIERASDFDWKQSAKSLAQLYRNAIESTT